VNKHDQTCCLFFSYLTLARGVVISPCSLLNWEPSAVTTQQHPLSESVET